MGVRSKLCLWDSPGAAAAALSASPPPPSRGARTPEASSGDVRAQAPRLPGTESGFAGRAPATALRTRDAPERLRPDGEFGRDGGCRAPRLGFAARPGRARGRAPARPAPARGARAPGASGVETSWSWCGFRLWGWLRPVLCHRQFSNLLRAVTLPPPPFLLVLLPATYLLQESCIILQPWRDPSPIRLALPLSVWDFEADTYPSPLFLLFLFCPRTPSSDFK